MHGTAFHQAIATVAALTEEMIRICVDLVDNINSLSDQLCCERIPIAMCYVTESNLLMTLAGLSQAEHFDHR